jgi:hypothetical protein
MANTTHDIERYYFLRATVRSRTVYVRCTPDVLVAVTDELFDTGFRVSPCEPWEYTLAIERRFEAYDFEKTDIIRFEP